jgi:hypothetical protein
LFLIFGGEGKSKWVEGSSNSSTTHRGHEVYMNEKVYLFGRENGDAVVMPAGIHRFNFEIELPAGLPSSVAFDLRMLFGQGKLRKLIVRPSFDDSKKHLLTVGFFHDCCGCLFGDLYGSVRYSVQAVLDVPWSLDRELSSFGFEVIHTGDYFTQPALTAPQKESVLITSAGCFRSLSGSIQVDVSIPSSVFAPGWTIPISIEIQNKSNRSVDKIVLKLKQTVTFTR